MVSLANTKLKPKLIFFFLVVGIIPLVVASFIAFKQAHDALAGANETAEEVLQNQIFAGLQAVEKNKQATIESYFQLIEDQILTFSEDRMVIDAMQEFRAAFVSYQEEDNIRAVDIVQMRRGLRAYYTEDFSNEYQAQNDGQIPPVESFLARLDDDSIALQYAYIKANPHPLGSKHLLDQAPMQSRYSTLHEKYHPAVRSYLEKFGYYDIFLVDPQTGDIVYSVFKELDYTTSLIDGPYAQTNFGRAFRAANQAGQKDAVILVDFEQYTPSYEAPASFIASPIFDGDRKVGVAIFQMPLDRISKVMGVRAGLGETGETYMVGSDYLMRSDSFFDPRRSVVNSFRNPDEGRVSTEAVDLALGGGQGTLRGTNYAGEEVLTAYSSVKVGNHIWAMIAEISAMEAVMPLQRMQADAKQAENNLLTISGGVVAVAAVLILLVALSVGKLIADPIERMVGLAQGIAAGDLKQSKIEVHSRDEIGQLGTTFNEMLDALRQLVVQAEDIAAGQLDSAMVVQKMEAGGSFEEAAAFVSEDNQKTQGDLAEAFDKMTVVLRKLTAQAQAIARDDLDNNVLGIEIPGELGAAFHEMIGRMQWLSDQASYIAKDDLYNDKLSIEGEGTMGGAMAHMVVNLRQTQQDLKERTEEAVERQRHILLVAERVMDASNGIASASEELSRTAAQMATGSENQQETVQGAATAVEEMTQSARGVSDNMDDLARLMTENSAALNELSSSVVSVTQNAEQMSQTVIANSSAIEELAASVQTQADGASQANETVQETNRVAEDGAQVVRQAIASMERIAERVRSSASTIGELGKSSEQISTIVGVIDDIADQTNLLALNAAIEAARAGEQGKGFMVVADEVRKLAERTSQATQEIDEMIRKIQTDTQEVVVSMEAGMSEVEQGTELAGKSGEALAEIGEGIGKVSLLMGQLTEASREQATTSDEIVSSTAEMNELVQQVANAMGQQTQAVEVVNQGSEEMQGRVDQVAHAMREQSETAAQIASSMEKVNGVATESLQSAREMDTATGELARQAEDLNALAGSFREAENLNEQASDPEDGTSEKQGANASNGDALLSGKV